MKKKQKEVGIRGKKAGGRENMEEEKVDRRRKEEEEKIETEKK